MIVPRLLVFTLMVSTIGFVSSIGAQQHKLQVLTENFPPYQVVRNGELVSGISTDIVDQMLKMAELESQTIVLPWARAYQRVRKQPNTLIYSMYRTTEREKLFQWIGLLHTVDTQMYISSHNDSVNISSLEDALNYNAVAVRKSATAEYLREIGFIENANLLLVNDYQSVWTMLYRGRAAFTYSEPPNPALLNNTSIRTTDFTPLPFFSAKRDLYVAASLEMDKLIVERLKKALQKVQSQRALTSKQKQ